MKRKILSGYRETGLSGGQRAGVHVTVSHTQLEPFIEQHGVNRHRVTLEVRLLPQLPTPVLFGKVDEEWIAGNA